MARMRYFFCSYRVSINGLLSARLILVMLLSLMLLFNLAVAAERPALSPAKQYVPGIDLTEYWVSEKYDGVRAYWDGEHLISRNGNIFNAPAWFVVDFPKLPLDGELWISRNQFAGIMSIVSRHQPHQQWQKIRYMIFDLPNANGDFNSRLEKMRQLFSEQQSAFLVLVKQEKIVDEEALMQKLDALTAAGGEGLMLRHAKSSHHNRDSSDLLKLKKFEDAEAVVIKYNAGKGKYAGLMGSIRVRDDDGKIFNIGSGFSDQERHQPPPLGSIITFKYQGFYNTGIPRFPVFWRQRNNAP